MKKFCLCIFALLFLVSGVWGQSTNQPAPKTFSVVIGGGDGFGKRYVTLVWTDPSKWVNPDINGQGFKISGIVKNTPFNQYVYYMFFPRNQNVYSVTLLLPPNRYVFSAYAVSSGFPDSNAKNVAFTVP